MENIYSPYRPLDPADGGIPSADTSKDVARILLDILMAHGVRDAICSPGSRNAPLLVAADARPALRTRIVTDERSAGFVALGIAQVSRRPVVLICTSGTALLNYAPAVAEAYYQGLPLIVVSADRPLEWIDQDDSQTLRQPEALRNFVKGSYDISDREAGDRPGWYDTRIANDAMLTALAPKQGPVHINVRLSPPLGATVSGTLSSTPRVIRRMGPSQKPEKDLVRELANTLKERRVMIVAGFLPPDARLNRAMTRMRAHDNVVVMAETLSNLHLPVEDYSIDSVLCTLRDEDAEAYHPDVVISIGGALVSRMLKEYLRLRAGSPGFEHWSVGFNHTTVDCFQALTLRIECDPGYFLSALSPELARARRALSKAPNGRNPESPAVYCELWHNARIKAIGRVMHEGATAGWSDFRAFRAILSLMPPKVNLFLSNGTSVRYAQILSFYRRPHAEYCNRGVSGIDGSTSTAAGGALAYNGDTVLVTGDMSFAYDLSALQTMKAIGSELKIIVIDNGGGGIFRFINSTSDLACRERYFCADPDAPIAALAGAYGMGYLHAATEEELYDALQLFFNARGAVILEITTPPAESAEVLREILTPSPADSTKRPDNKTSKTSHLK
ncbi:MAG: 2-succinyl-5-enolpyruvyl-6-hydroxy-3-cyclohexene-1-carboxylic-acid synthase [Muribaculaceae bacterium]|nr:2-succinyl-5-enolpyruvyl-6-hydroxy-3-cyclohexene-1-carboxylic-acid synthase [Muribaculaceae bacterium]